MLEKMTAAASVLVFGFYFVANVFYSIALSLQL